MIVELQLDANTFLKSFREQMRTALACELTEDVLDFNPADSVPGEPFIVVGYEVGTTTLRRARTQTMVAIHTGSLKTTTLRPVFKPEIVQDLVVHISWVKDLRAANTHKAATVPLHLPLVFELAMDTVGNPQVLCFNYLGLDAFPAEDPIAQKLGGRIHGSCTWIPIERVIGRYMPKDMTLVNGHLSMSESHQCIAVRLEFWDEAWGAASGDPARTVPYWDLFYTHGVIDRLQQGNTRAGWNMFLDHHAILGFVKEQVLSSIKGQSGVTITRQPSVQWFDDAGRVRIHVDLEVEKKDACYCGTEDLDVAAEITADVYIAVPALNTVRIDLYSNVAPDFWDATCCVLTAAAFWPILGFGQMATGAVNGWEYMAGLVPFVSFIAAILKVNDAHFEAKGPWIEDEDDEDHAYSEDHLSLPADPNFGQLSVLGSKPLADGSTLQAYGLFLWGGMDVASKPQPVLQDPQVEHFCWSKANRCSRRIVASSQFRLFPVNPLHWALLHVCGARVIDDPLDIYSLEVRKEEHGFYDLVLTVDFWRMNADYWKPGGNYPCRVLLKTTGGVRILTLKPLAALSEEQFKALAKQAAFEYVNNCYLPRHRLFEELEWPIQQLIDQPGLRYVQVRAVGLPPGEQIDLLGEQGEAVGRYTVSESGTLLVTALSQRGNGPRDGLRLRRAAAGVVGATALPGRMRILSGPRPMPTPFLHAGDAPGLEGQTGVRADGATAPRMAQGAAPDMLSRVCPPDALGRPSDMIRVSDDRISIQAAAMAGLAELDTTRGVIVRETMLETRGQIRAASSVHALLGSGARLVVVMDGLVEAYELADHGMPVLSEAWRAGGVRGAVMFGERLLLWGAPGIWVASDGVPARPAPFTACGLDGVRGAAVLGERLYVLVGVEVRIYDRQLCEVARHDAHDVEEFVAAGDVLVLRTRDGLHVSDYTAAPAPRDGGRRPVDRAAVGCELRGVSRIEAVALPLGRPVVYAYSAHGATLLRPRVSGHLEVMAEFAGDAWFAGLVRVGQTLAYVADGGRIIRLLAPRQTAATE